jgi:hypothetical protein
MSTDTQNLHLVNASTMESGEMSFQEVFIHCPMLQNSFLCLLLVSMGSSQVLAIPYTDDTVTEWFISYHIKNRQVRGHATRFVFGLEIQIFHFLCPVTLESI